MIYQSINDESFVNITQIRYLDSKRFYRFVCILEKMKFKEIITQLLEKIINDERNIYQELIYKNSMLKLSLY